MAEKRQSWSAAAGGHVVLEERSPHVDALSRLGDLRPHLRLPEIHYLKLGRDEARLRLRSLPRTADLDMAIDAVDRARLGDPASPVTIELLLTAYLEVTPTARTVRRAQLIGAAKAHLRVTGSVLAAVLRAMLPRRREAPTIAEIAEAADAEIEKLERASMQLARVDGLRTAAVVALDWCDPNDAAFLAEVGDPVPPAWPAVGPGEIDW